MTGREAEILGSVTGMLQLALDMLPAGEPAGEEHARGWITAAAAQVDGLLTARGPGGDRRLPERSAHPFRRRLSVTCDPGMPALPC